MDTAKATLNDHRQSPRKVRLMAGLVRGKKVADALALLSFAGKKSASPVKKLLESAIANAKNRGMDETNLIVKEIQVNPGAIMYRRLPMSRGRAFTKRKRTSHIDIVLGMKEEKAVKAVKAPKAVKKAVKATVKK